MESLLPDILVAPVGQAVPDMPASSVDRVRHSLPDLLRWFCRVELPETPHATREHGTKSRKQVPTGMRIRVLCQCFGRAGSDHRAPGRSAFGAKIDDPVGASNHVKIVFDHDQ